MIFTKDNIPDLLEYLAGYMRENPEVATGFGLEMNMIGYDSWKDSEFTLTQIAAGVNGAVWQYRIKPDTYTVYGPDGVGVECPAPYREKPESDANYFTIDPRYESGTDHYLWDDDKFDNELFKKGECFKSKEDAIATHNARYGIKS